MAAVLVVAAGSAAAEDPSATPVDPEQGVLAAAVGERVVLADPLGRWSRSFGTGPVAWLFPAPGARLFAPDLVGGRTTVLDVAAVAVSERLDGVTMPWFGESPDRYLAVAGDLLLVSYPDRSVLKTVSASVEHPWQAALAGGDTYAIVLDRHPDGVGDAEIVIADLAEGRLLLRGPVGGDPVAFAMGSAGALALADAAGARLLLVRAATLDTVAEVQLGGRPVDLVAVGGGDDEIAVAWRDPGGGGGVDRWKVKQGRDGVTLLQAASWRSDGAPVRLAASPGGAAVAVALEDGTVVVLHGRDLEPGAALDVGGAPRDLCWCDPSVPGPKLPLWSDRTPAEELRLRRP